jgi:hypothetical protein
MKIRSSFGSLLVAVIALSIVVVSRVYAGEESGWSPEPRRELSGWWSLHPSRSISFVPKTGQVDCWDGVGTPVDCTGTGEDGEYQIGVSTVPRFTDMGNGTVMDNLTGLTWLKNADCFGLKSWSDALSAANTLASGHCGLTDGSAERTWRLPNVKELTSLLDFGHTNPALVPGHPFVGVEPHGYWTSTTVESVPANAWDVYLDFGFVSYFDGKGGLLYVWPVKGGQ